MAKKPAYRAGRDQAATAENVELLTGQRGDRLDKAVTFRELAALGLSTLRPGAGGVHVPGKNPDLFPPGQMEFPHAPVNVIANGFATVGNDQPLTSAYQFHNPDLAPKSYDPDQAKFYLKKAGFDSLDLELFTSETPFAGATDASVMFAEQAAKAGINIKVTKTPEDGYWSDIWFVKPFVAARWSGRANEDAMLSLVYTTAGVEAGWNETHMADPKLDGMIMAARTEFDEAKRRQIYYDIQTLISETGGAVTPVFANFVDACSSKVKHGELANDWPMDGARFAERWWFE